MPIMSGIQIYGEIKKINPKQKILFITGYSEEMIPDLNLKNVDVLYKPFKLSNIDEKIMTLMD